MCHAAAAEAGRLARPGTPGSMLTVGKGSSAAEARLAGGHATAAAAAAAIRSATKGADGAIRPADTLNTMPAADFDLSVMYNINGEEVKRLIVSTQDFPSGVEARNKTGAPARAFAQRMTATPDTRPTPWRARRPSRPPRWP